MSRERRKYFLENQAPPKAGVTYFQTCKLIRDFIAYDLNDIESMWNCHRWDMGNRVAEIILVVKSDAKPVWGVARDRGKHQDLASQPSRPRKSAIKT